ncbi:PREDICTED: non-specific lipid-transfer protein 3-like [Tarenaya hassleriana]|uniref:non-specific lipid-transfer protein 3-like n=1 Tax=Tarenaya hassleriana TaxID=28532 RepID=UPI00053C7D5A|nr:PREDICTED: non-specific lipid-transfer protein 3-like [Tarenaya hassleriana]
MASPLLKLTCLVLVVAAAWPATEAALSCGTVASKLAPCVSYLTRGGAVQPQCCAGIRGLAAMARTTVDRRQACRCMQNAARGMGNVNAGRAAALPRVCRVKIPYPISLSTNCNNVK